MSFRVLDALPLLVIRYGETINKVPSGDRRGLENQKVMGFRTRSAKVLALDVYPNNLEYVRLWIEPPGMPKITGVAAHGPKKCADLRRSELNALADAKGLYLEVETAKAFEDLLNWYA